MIKKSFLMDEDGAVTVDWVVLTASIVGLGIASAAAVRVGTSSLGGDIQTSLDGTTVATLGELGSGVFEYAVRWFSQSSFDFSVRAYTSHTQGNLEMRYAQFVQGVETSLASGNQSESGRYLDQLAMITMAMENNGYPIPSGTPTLQEMDTQYSAQFN